jgi:hypothetical protein
MNRSFLTLGAAALVACAGASHAQVQLYALGFNGNLYTVNQSTGALTVVGATGFTRLNAAAYGPDGMIYTSRFHNTAIPGDPYQFLKINPATGAGTLIADYGQTNDLRALAFVPSGTLYGIIDGVPDQLASVNPATGAVTLIGPTGRNDLQGLTSNAAGQLFACGVTGSGVLCSIDPATGAATVIASDIGAPLDMNTIEWIAGDQAFAGQSNLYRVNLSTGATSLVGPFGTDIRGLAAAHAFPPPCYANCDGSTVPPVLNVLDFNCFLNQFSAGASYANCDGSTVPPVLNVLDFNCFLNRFSAGCP